MAPDPDPPDAEAIRDHLVLMVEKAANALGQHFDAVRIFASKHGVMDPNETMSITNGRGNFPAQQGQIWTWMIRQDEYTRIAARGDSDGDEEDE